MTRRAALRLARACGLEGFPSNAQIVDSGLSRREFMTVFWRVYRRAGRSDWDALA
jgi:hypothetical protein